MVPQTIQSKLRVEAGMATLAGPKASNDDCLGLRAPEGAELATKGVAAAVADGVSAAERGKEAAEICVKGFLNDYYDAPEAWTAETCGLRVCAALNRWLYGLGQSSMRDSGGYLTTFTALVLKGQRAYCFHVGDTRAYRIRRGGIEPMTRDHSFNFGQGALGLARAMGMDTRVEVDATDFGIEAGDLLLLSSDGIHGTLTDREIVEIASGAAGGGAAALDGAALALADRALRAGSRDNCSAMLIEVLEAGEASNNERYRQFQRLPFLPDLAPGMKVDGYEIEAELESSSRSQVYLARELESGRVVALKTPSRNFEDDIGYLERFAMEGWVGKKVKSEHLAAALSPPGEQRFLYNVFEYIEGPSFRKWSRSRPPPEARQVVTMGKQILQGLRAMHRQEMLHQDLKPENVIIHPARGAVIVDYGSAWVGGLQEAVSRSDAQGPAGTRGYSAPECIMGRRPTRKSDLFSLGVMLYEALTAELPYGEAYERAQAARDFALLEYRPATRFNAHVPVWLDGCLRKAVALNPQLRYESFSEFEYDLEHPNATLLGPEKLPFLERQPARFWKIATGLLALSHVATWLWLRR